MSPDEILAFIAEFTFDGKYVDVIETFTSGCCYWFAFILSMRFNGVIVYDDVNGHFGCRIEGRVYDIRGDVTETADRGWRVWSRYELGGEHRRQVYQSCVLLNRRTEE